MSAHISFHGPYTFGARAPDGGGYVEFKIGAAGYVAIFLHGREQADALVKAALAARDLLPELDHCPECAHRLGTGCGDPCCGILACASCGATPGQAPGGLLAVHNTGADGSVSYYCADTGACARRRHAAHAAQDSLAVAAFHAPQVTP